MYTKKLLFQLPFDIKKTRDMFYPSGKYFVPNKCENK